MQDIYIDDLFQSVLQDKYGIRNTDTLVLRAKSVESLRVISHLNHLSSLVNYNDYSDYYSNSMYTNYGIYICLKQYMNMVQYVPEDKLRTLLLCAYLDVFHTITRSRV